MYVSHTHLHNMHIYTCMQCTRLFKQLLCCLVLTYYIIFVFVVGECFQIVWFFCVRQLSYEIASIGPTMGRVV